MALVRTLFFALLLAASLAACSDEEEVEIGEVTEDPVVTSEEPLVGEPSGAVVGVESITLTNADGTEIEAPASTDNPFHAVVRVDEGGGGNVVKVDLIAVDAGGEQNTEVVSQTYTLEGINNQVDVEFSLPQPWPTGQYRIDAYVNGELAEQREFAIQ